MFIVNKNGNHNRRDGTQFVENVEGWRIVNRPWVDEDHPWERANSENLKESFYSALMFVRRSCKPELVTNTNDSDLENDIELIVDREDDGTYI